jgi:CheY-like chemotaxis protein
VTKAREAGFDGHLAKPPSPEAIATMLRDARS